MKNWWLLLLCGVFQAMYAAMTFLTQRPDGTITLRTSVDSRGTLVRMGLLVLAAGVCIIVAGVWSRKGNSWLLVLNGLAGGVLGALFAFWTGPLAFRAIALLIAGMALSISLFGWTAGRALREYLMGVGGLGFAVAFLAFVFGWIQLNPQSPAQSLFWVGSYFGFSALCMLALGLRLKRIAT